MSPDVFRRDFSEYGLQFRKQPSLFFTATHMLSPKPIRRNEPSAGLIARGRVSAAELRVIAANIQVLMNLPVELLAPMAIPEEAFQPHRGQYDAGLILKRLAQLPFPHQRCILTVTDVDLCTPSGRRKWDKKRAIVSGFRLKDTPDGFPAPADVYYERLVKIALHEIAHTSSLYHCEAPKCLMRFSPKVQDLDALDISFCRRCGLPFTARWGKASGNEDSGLFGPRRCLLRRGIAEEGGGECSIAACAGVLSAVLTCAGTRARGHPTGDGTGCRECPRHSRRPWRQQEIRKPT